MKKRNLKQLVLNKNVVSNLKINRIVGGDDEPGNTTYDETFCNYQGPSRFVLVSICLCK